MRFYESERPIAIQIFGWDLQRMRDAAVMVQDSGVDIVDINCGCPAPKVVKRGGGCDLMRQPDHFAKLLKEVRRAVSIPMTVKFRSGWDAENINAVEFARIAESEGADALAVHGRTRAQLYRGDADWEIVRAVASAVKIPVLGSGDVKDADSARDRMRGGVAGLMVGRAAISNPLVFGQILNGEPNNLRRDSQKLIEIVQRYIEILTEDFEPRHCVGRVKQLVSQMARGHSWSRDLCRINTLPEQKAMLDMTRLEMTRTELDRAKAAVDSVACANLGQPNA